MTVVDRFELQKFELACSLYSGSFADDETKYLVVGTGLALPDEIEAISGRILVFTKSDRRMHLASEFSIDGCAYSMVSIQRKLFVGVNTTVFYNL
jgi:hypothetical protein